MAAVILLPAQQDLDDAKVYLDRVHAAESHRADRLERYQKYLTAVQRGDEAVIRSLAATQLNQAPAGRELLVPEDGHGPRSASVFDSLEPPPLVLPEGQPAPSRLQRWATDDRTRLWLIGAAALCLLIGVLPPARARD